MEQRDYIKDQIEQMGRALAKLLSNFYAFKSKNQVPEGIEVTNQQFKAEINIDIDKIISLPRNELKEYLQYNKLIADHLEYLSEYIKEMALKEGQINNSLIKRAILLLDISDEISGTISFERIRKRNILEELLR